MSKPSRLGDAPLFAPYFCPRILKVLRNENLFLYPLAFSATSYRTSTRYYPNPQRYCLRPKHTRTPNRSYRSGAKLRPCYSTTTDQNGHFTLPNLHLGRVTLEVSYIGYDSQTIPEVLITSAKEVVLNIALREAFTELEGVEIVAGIRKEKALNTMATVSARTFSVEETQRYAGGLSDPARLASAFAGVSTGNLQDNSIIVRGNAPQGVQWRLEGVEIPSPQHFSACNVTGDGAVALIVDKIAKREDSGERG